MHIPLPSLCPALAPITAALDRATADQRRNWMQGLGRRELAALWTRATAEGLPLDLDWLAGPAGETVTFAGQTSRPAFVRFARRLWMDPETGAVQGHSQPAAAVAWLAGPGHFRAAAASDRLLHLDHRTLPAGVPPGFPPLVDNASGGRKAVYGDRVDHLRRVSVHCAVGRVVHADQPLSAWFMLVRATDPPGAAAP